MSIKKIILSIVLISNFMHGSYVFAMQQEDDAAPSLASSRPYSPKPPNCLQEPCIPKENKITIRRERHRSTSKCSKNTKRAAIGTSLILVAGGAAAGICLGTQGPSDDTIHSIPPNTTASPDFSEISSSTLFSRKTSLSPSFKARRTTTNPHPYAPFAKGLGISPEALGHGLECWHNKTRTPEFFRKFANKGEKAASLYSGWSAYELTRAETGVPPISSTYCSRNDERWSNCSERVSKAGENFNMTFPAGASYKYKLLLMEKKFIAKEPCFGDPSSKGRNKRHANEETPQEKSKRSSQEHRNGLSWAGASKNIGSDVASEISSVRGWFCSMWDWANTLVAR